MIEFKHEDNENVVFYYYDASLCFNLRRSIHTCCSWVSFYSEWVVKSTLFESLCILVILLNSYFIMIADPTKTNTISDQVDNYFLYFYTFEAIMKILGFGFVWNDNSYLRDSWNILDFIIIVIGWLTIVLCIFLLI